MLTKKRYRGWKKNLGGSWGLSNYTEDFTTKKNTYILQNFLNFESRKVDVPFFLRIFLNCYGESFQENFPEKNKIERTRFYSHIETFSIKLVWPRLIFSLLQPA